MPRRKGKSRRRVKDWKRRFRRKHPDELDEAHDLESLQPERVKLGPDRTAGVEDADLAGRPHAEGMVTGMFRGGAYVRLDGQDLPCRIAGTFRAPEGFSALTVGDKVTVALTPAEHLSGDRSLDKDRADGVILSRQPRETALSRPSAFRGKRRGRYEDAGAEKVIVANMDDLLIVVATREPPTRPGLIDRFCIIAERGEMEPIVVFNKIDLADPDAAVLAELEAGDVRIVCCSAVTGEGLEELRSAIRDRRSVLAGASGVGKSTLVNALVPGAELATREVRAKDQRGRHMTASATVHALPAGGVIVDTPGIRELATGIDAAELPWYFPEMADLAGDCRFNNCTHTHEPDCAVRDAVEAERIPMRRYHSYLRILETL
ncbi:MAG: ribosome small subunit-dependent GTPase A [Planctomycetota bacterium]|jgi:ribosome biogenesis GTPase